MRRYQHDKKFVIAVRFDEIIKISKYLRVQALTTKVYLPGYTFAD